MTSRQSPTIGTSACRFLEISAGSMSACTMLAWGANELSLPVTRSSNRAPSAMIRSDLCIAATIPDYRGPGSPSRHADDLPGVRLRAGGAAALLGAQPPRLVGGWAAPSPTPATARWPGSTPTLLITQNVDGLHEARRLAPPGRAARPDRRRRLPVLPAYDEPGAARRSGWRAPTPASPTRHARAATRPDGDVDLDDTAGFVVPDCDACGGVLKPDVVFFGENVPPARVQRCYDAVDALTPDDALLVVGSSLTVMSGFRFVRRAAKAGVPRW